MKSSYDKMRLYSLNILLYLKELYSVSHILAPVRHINVAINYLQNDFGPTNDCTLTSAMTILKYYLKDIDENVIYNTIYKFGLKYGFTEKWGTIPVVHRIILSKAAQELKLNNKFTSCYIKGIGYNFEKIKKVLDENKLVMLSVFNDGRNYYESHSITVVGYEIYTINGKEVPMLLVYDNWYNSYSYVDYSRISPISMIVY